MISNATLEIVDYAAGSGQAVVFREWALLVGIHSDKNHNGRQGT